MPTEPEWQVTLTALEELFKATGTPVPLLELTSILDAVRRRITSQGQLDVEYEALAADAQLNRLQQIVEDTISPRDAHFQTIEAQLDQIINLLYRGLHDHTPPPASFSRLSHILDRTSYWTTLRWTCERSSENAAFVVHGAAQQNVEFFTTRVRNYLDQSGAREHRVVDVSSDLDQTRAAEPGDWADRRTGPARRIHEGTAAQHPANGVSVSLSLSFAGSVVGLVS